MKLEPPLVAGCDVIDVGVVVVTYNSTSVVGTLMSTLEEGLRDLTWSATFVDNASSDNTIELVTAAGFEVVSLDANRGYAFAINEGAQRLGNARAILILNPDVELSPGSVAAMAKVLGDERVVGVVAPKMYLPDEQSSLERSQRREPSLSRTWGTALLGGPLSRRLAACSEAVADSRCYESAIDVDWAVGAVLLTSRRCFDTLGGWDESFFLYSEETDYCRRARDAGFAVRYTPEATVRHKGGDSFVNARLRSMMIVNKVRYYRRLHNVVASWCFFAGTLFHELTRSIAGRARIAGGGHRTALASSPAARDERIGVTTPEMTSALQSSVLRSRDRLAIRPLVASPRVAGPRGVERHRWAVLTAVSGRACLEHVVDELDVGSLVAERLAPIISTRAAVDAESSRRGEEQVLLDQVVAHRLKVTVAHEIS